MVWISEKTNSTYTCLQIGWSTILFVHIFAFKNDALKIACTIYLMSSLLTVRSLEMSGILFNTSGVLLSGFSLSTSLILTFWNRNKTSEYPMGITVLYIEHCHTGVFDTWYQQQHTVITLINKNVTYWA